MSIVTEYEILLAGIDAWFARCQDHYPAEIACGKGCCACCRGLFDITALDAALLNRGFSALPDGTKATVRQKAAVHLQSIQNGWPDFDYPFILNRYPEEESEALLATDNETACVLLDENGRCLLYACRPMTCRLHGLPLINVTGEVMEEEWCTKNFRGSNPLELASLRAEFERLFYIEADLGRRFTEELIGQALAELDTLIPAALLIDFKDFDWRKWVAENQLRT